MLDAGSCLWPRLDDALFVYIGLKRGACIDIEVIY